MGAVTSRPVPAVGWFLLVVAGVVLVVAMLTAALRPGAATPPIMSDALGPDNGQRVDDYLAYAASTLDDPAGDPGDRRWALVSYDDARPVGEAAAPIDAAGITRISQVLLATPVEGVSMPVIPAAVAAPTSTDAGHSGPLGRAAASAVINGFFALDHPGRGVPTAGTTTEQAPVRPADARERAKFELTAETVSRGGPSVIAVIVRADIAPLRALAGPRGTGAVRSVEALPPDAVWGRFAVRPLLPGYTDVVAPLPDNAAVPEPALPGE